jgi:glutamate formiminotransferase/formiminotetrahydrofolate cyclodeaminase
MRKKIRNQAIQDATRYAIEVPLKVMQLALNSMEIINHGKEEINSISDAGVGAPGARSAVLVPT